MGGLIGGAARVGGSGAARMPMIAEWARGARQGHTAGIGRLRAVAFRGLERTRVVKGRRARQA